MKNNRYIETEAAFRHALNVGGGLSRFRAEVTRDRYARDLPRVSAMLARADNPS